MENIELKVTKSTISVTNQYILNQGEYNVDKCVFDFSDDYNDLIKKAVFIYNDEEPIQMVILDNECNIPYELLQVANEFTLKVYAYEVQNNELVQRYSPTPLKIFLREGSYQGSNEVITPSQFEQYEAKLDEGLKEVDDKLEVVDETLVTMNTAINEANTLNIDVSDKVNKDVTITLTKKDNTTKSVVVSDGDDFQYNWDGTKLGVKTDKEQSYTYVDLKGPQGPIGPKGEAFQIKKTYTTIQEMIADYDNMQVNDYVMISGSVEQQDNATLWVKAETEDPTYKWVYLADFSGASGIQGPTGETPNIQIGNVTSGDNPNVIRRGTDENPILDFTLVRGEQGIQGETGNGIDSIEKTSTSGLVDTYTITYDNGDTDTFDVTNGADGNVTDVQVDGTSVVDNGIANIEGINKLKQDVEMYKMLENALPKVEEEGETIHLEDTAKCPMKLGFKGQIQQVSTTGKNMFNNQTPNINQITWTPTINGGLFTSLTHWKNLGNKLELDTTKQYTFSFGARNSTNLYYYIKTYTDNTYETVKTTIVNDGTALSKTFTPDSEYVAIYFSNGGNLQNIEIPNIQLEIGSSVTNFEPYTGESPSPSPDYPQDIHIVSGDNEIKVCNKNLFDKNSVVGGFVNADGSIGGDTNAYRTSDFIPIQPNTAYYKTNTESPRTKYYDINKQPLNTTTYQDISIGGNAGTFTTPNNVSYLRFSYPIASIDDSTIQIEKGNQATSYVEHKEYTKEINLGDIEVGGIGEYEDEFLKNTIDSEYYDSTLLQDKWYLKKRIGKVVLDGTQTNPEVNTTSANTTRVFYNYDLLDYIPIPNYGLCNQLTYYSNWSQDIEGFYVNDGNKKLIFRMNKTTIGTSVNEVNAYLSSNNLIIYYVLATPTYTEITDSTLISQLEATKSAYSYQEQTNISQDNNDIPFVIKASAIYDLSNLVPSSSLSSVATLNMNRLTNTNLQETPLEVETETTPMEEEIKD